MGTVLKTLGAAFRTVLELACREGLTKRWWPGCLSMAKLSSICFLQPLSHSPFLMALAVLFGII